MYTLKRFLKSRTYAYSTLFGKCRLVGCFFFFFLILSTTQIGVNKSFNDETNISNYTELTSYQGYTK